MARLTRRSFRRRTSLSKYESALEAAYKEKKVVRVTADVTLDSVPDIILYDATAGNIVVTIAVPASAPQEESRVVRVAEEVASANTISIQVVDGTNPTTPTSASAEYLIEDASTNAEPILL